MSLRYLGGRAAWVVTAAGIGIFIAGGSYAAQAGQRGWDGWRPFATPAHNGWEAPWARERERDAEPYWRARPYDRRDSDNRRDSDRGDAWGSAGAPDERAHASQWSDAPAPGRPTLSPANVEATRAAIERYAAIVARGGWRQLPDVEMRRGGRGEAVAALRHRLELTGDLPPQDGRYSVEYDAEVEDGVMRFQRRHGLATTGVADRTTVMALNVPASSRLAQLRTNSVRLETLSKSAGNRYVVVNIPAAEVEAVESDRVVSRHMGVVGKIDRQTPLLRSEIHEVNFNPYWHVPQSIVRRDLVPQARDFVQEGRDLLEEYRMEAFDGDGSRIDPRRIDWYSDAVYNYRYRQMPWEENSLGFVRINFHNQHSVFLHDTPIQNLFSQNWRAESSGCVRVQNIEDLVAWLLEGTEGWDRNRVLEMKRNGERRDVTVATRTPIYLVYVSAWATQDGTVQFRRDIYRQDDVDQTASAY